MESPKVQKVSHWLSKKWKINSHPQGSGLNIDLDFMRFHVFNGTQHPWLWPPINDTNQKNIKILNLWRGVYPSPGLLWFGVNGVSIWICWTQSLGHFFLLDIIFPTSGMLETLMKDS